MIVMAQAHCMAGWLSSIKPTSNSDGEMEDDLDSDFGGSLSELGIDLTSNTYNMRQAIIMFFKTSILFNNIQTE